MLHCASHTLVTLSKSFCWACILAWWGTWLRALFLKSLCYEHYCLNQPLKFLNDFGYREWRFREPKGGAVFETHSSTAPIALRRDWGLPSQYLVSSAGLEELGVARWHSNTQLCDMEAGCGNWNSLAQELRPLGWATLRQWDKKPASCEEQLRVPVAVPSLFLFLISGHIFSDTGCGVR